MFKKWIDKIKDKKKNKATTFKEEKIEEDEFSNRLQQMPTR